MEQVLVNNMVHAEPDKFSIANLIAESYTLEQAGDVSTALKVAKQAVTLARGGADVDSLAAALVCVANCQYHLGHFNQASTLADEALSMAPPDSQTSAEALRILGNCTHETGDLTSAEGFYHRAIDIARSQGYHSVLQSCLHSLSACVYLPRGQFELALAADEEALHLALELGLRELAWFPLEMMGWIYWVRGQRELAVATVQKMSSFVQPGSMAEGYYLCLCGDLATDAENPGSACELLAHARSIAEMIGDPGLNAEVRLSLSRCHRRLGNPSAACRWAEDALATAQRAGSSDLQVGALIEHSLSAWAGGDLAQAESDLKAATVLLACNQADYDRARISFYQAALYHHQMRPEVDAAWLEAVQRITSGGYAFLLERERRLAFPLLAHHLNSPDPQVAVLTNQLLGHLANVPPPPLVIDTLGRFVVRQGGQAIPDQAWRQRKAGELFRLLLVSPRRSALREQVIDALWPDKPPAVAQTLFHQATSSLRKALEPDLPEKFPSRYLWVDRGEISLQLPEGSRVDFEHFEEQIRNQAWEAALERYRGDLFPGDVYADWAAEPRERLKQTVVRAALAVARDAIQARQYEKALSACQRALALEPWQEEAVLLGMQACIAQNDRSGAIRMYKKLERALREELDVTPQEVVQAYYRSVLEH